MIKKILIGLVVLFVVVILVGMFKFNFLASLDGYNVDGNKIKVDTEFFVDEKNETSICEDDRFCDRNTEEVDKKDSESISANNIPDFYRDLKISSEKEITIEISRSLKDCVGIIPQKCMQVKEEGKEWELFYDIIYGFDYIEGNYYVLKVLEKRYITTSEKPIPVDAPSVTWELTKIVKNIIK